MSKLVRGITKELNALFFAADTTDIVNVAREVHGCSNTATAALGRLLTASSLLGVALKDNSHKLTLRVVGDGPLGYVLANSNRSGNVKGVVQNPQIELPLNEQSKLSVGKAIGEGNLYVIKDLGMKEPYVGISKLISGEIGDDISSYLYQSEQVNSVVALGVLVGDHLVKCSGGIIVQLLPGASDEFISKLEERLKTFSSVTDYLSQSGSIEKVVEALFEGVEEVEFTDTQEIAYECDCSKERFYRGLITLGENDLDEIFLTQGVAEASCQFCNKKYEYTREDFSEILGG
ncbi:MAG: Hsp33 family molecular chaperone HslO [Fusobacteria bacterium]|nr:Hsp33 family molecular chaperone HslO [Fusobacteriota bacterium]